MFRHTFQQKRYIKLLDSFLYGATFTGNSWLNMQTSNADAMTYDALPTQNPWRLMRVNQVEQVQPGVPTSPTYTSHRYDMVATKNTTTSQATALMGYDVPTNATVLVSCPCGSQGRG